MRDKNIWPSMRLLSDAKKISVAALKRAKKMNAPGFIKNTIDWSLLEPWYKEHEVEIVDSIDLEEDTDSLLFYKKEIAKRDVTLRDLEIKKKKELFLDPDQVIEFLQNIAIAQNALFNARMKELPVKLAGKSAEDIDIALKEVASEVCKVYNAGLKSYFKQ